MWFWNFILVIVILVAQRLYLINKTTCGRCPAVVPRGRPGGNMTSFFLLFCRGAASCLISKLYFSDLRTSDCRGALWIPVQYRWTVAESLFFKQERCSFFVRGEDKATQHLLEMDKSWFSKHDFLKANSVCLRDLMLNVDENQSNLWLSVSEPLCWIAISLVMWTLSC